MSHISAGLSTDVLKRSGENCHSHLFLSLVCAGRSVDLCYENENDRNAWKSLLDTLCSKEHGKLTGIEGITPGSPAIKTRAGSGSGTGVGTGGSGKVTPTSESVTDGTTMPSLLSTSDSSRSPSSIQLSTPVTPSLSRSSSFVVTANESKESVVEWSVLYSTIGPEIVPFTVIENILNLDVQFNEDGKSVDSYDRNSVSSSIKSLTISPTANKT